MKYYINEDETNMTEEEIHALEQDAQRTADEFGQLAINKIEPYTRVITLLGFAVASVFLLVAVLRGSYEGGVSLLFLAIEDTTTMYTATAAMVGITLWYLVSTIRFFVKRNNEKNEEAL